MTGNLEKYSDYSVLLIEMLNAKRSFSFSMHSERNFRKLLWREKVMGMVMSPKTLFHIHSIYRDFNRFLSELMVIDSPFQMVTVFSIPTAIVDDMEDGKMMLLNDENEAIVVKIF